MPFDPASAVLGGSRGPPPRGAANGAGPLALTLHAVLSLEGSAPQRAAAARSSTPQPTRRARAAGWGLVTRPPPPGPARVGPPRALAPAPRDQFARLLAPRPVARVLPSPSGCAFPCFGTQDQAPCFLHQLFCKRRGMSCACHPRPVPASVLSQPPAFLGTCPEQAKASARRAPHEAAPPWRALYHQQNLPPTPAVCRRRPFPAVYHHPPAPAPPAIRFFRVPNFEGPSRICGRARRGVGACPAWRRHQPASQPASQARPGQAHALRMKNPTEPTPVSPQPPPSSPLHGLPNMLRWAPFPRGARPLPTAPLPRGARPLPTAPVPRGARPLPTAPLPRGARPLPIAPGRQTRLPLVPPPPAPSPAWCRPQLTHQQGQRARALPFRFVTLLTLTGSLDRLHRMAAAGPKRGGKTGPRVCRGGVTDKSEEGGDDAAERVDTRQVTFERQKTKGRDGAMPRKPARPSAA